MHQIYVLARIYPFWALPLALVLVYFGRYCRRRRMKTQWVFWVVIVALVLTSIAWIAKRGDLHSDEWVGDSFEDFRS